MKELKVDMDTLIKQTYFRIAKWHNNEEELSSEQMRVRLMGVSSELIEHIITTAFSDQNKEIRVENEKAIENANDKVNINDSGLLSSLDLDLGRIKDIKN